MPLETEIIIPRAHCRPEQYFGAWAILPDVHQQLVGHFLQTHHVREINDEPKPLRQGYFVNGRTAVVTMAGALTKYPGSMDEEGTGSTVRARMGIRAAVKDPNVDRILVYFDGVPGGTVDGTWDVWNDIRNANNVKPVYAHANDCCASGGLWIASAARRITANVNAQVGSIGAFTILYDTSGRMEKEGIKVHVIGTGGVKGMGAPGAPVLPEHVAAIQSRIDDIGKLFVKCIAIGRNKPEDQIAKLANGEVFIADKAKEHGLIDGVCSLDEAIDGLNSKSSPQLVSRGTVAAHDMLAATMTGKVPARKAMPFTADQMARVRKLPGCESVTDENAEARVLEVAETAVRERTDLQTKVPKPIDAEVLNGRAENALERFEVMLEKGQITSAQLDVLKPALAKDSPLQSLMVQKVQEGKTVAALVADVLALNKPNGLTNQVSAGQPQPRTEPGKGSTTQRPINAAADEGSDEELAYINQCRADAGLPPIAKRGERPTLAGADSNGNGNGRH